VGFELCGPGASGVGGKVCADTGSGGSGAGDEQITAQNLKQPKTIIECEIHSK
jgi:hypothetical protein